MRDPPLCKLWELEEGGRYTIDHLADFHEMMDEEAEYARRFAELEKRK